jgi:16S rRNA (guanine527-N7)-methyltransferase
MVKGIKLIEKYYPDLTKEQLSKLSLLEAHYLDWNSKINVISRKDTEHIFLHHILHSLVISKFIKFLPGARVLDLGTGGGLPGIPLSIIFPEVQFTLVDGTNKKITVVKDIVEKLDIRNVEAIHTRAEEMTSKYDFIVTRAVAKIAKLLEYSRKLIHEDHIHVIPNGIIALKGGEMKNELSELGKKEYYELEQLSSFYEEEYFSTKVLLYLQV